MGTPDKQIVCRSIQKVAVFLVAADPGPGITAQRGDLPSLRAGDFRDAPHQLAGRSRSPQGNGGLHMPDHEVGPAPLVGREGDLAVPLQLEPMAVPIVPNVTAHVSIHLTDTAQQERDPADGVPQAAKLQASRQEQYEAWSISNWTIERVTD